MKDKIIELKIDALGKNGKGLGHFIDGALQEKVAEVSFAAPGDIWEVEIKRKKSGVYPARGLRMSQASPQRIKPRCVHFGECGGCSLQHIDYQDQLRHKERMVREIYTELLHPELVFMDIIGCDMPWEYRNKMEFSFSQDLKGNRFLGLMLAGARGKVFNLSECHLCAPWFAESLLYVRKWWETTSLDAYHPPSNRGALRTLTLREGKTTGDRMAMLTVSGNPEYALHKNDLAGFKALFDEKVSLFLRIQQAIKGQPTEFFELHLGGPESIREIVSISLDSQKKMSEVHFAISPSAFFQPNTLSAIKLYRQALNLANLSSEDVVYDLYCGTGTLGLLAARFVKFVLGIELSPESSLDARENAKANKIDNIEILTGAVESLLAESGRYPLPSVVLLDPPRAGLDPKAIAHLIALNPPKIVYISCNPDTQFRDIKELVSKGYCLSKLQPVDQFPQTPHIENIALLTKI